MTAFNLTELQYSEDRRGPWMLYIYTNGDYHSGGVWFSESPRWICDGGDMLVYHWKGGLLLHGANFWSEIKEGRS